MNKQLVVMGGGLGGLSAAIHARLAGYEVLVLEQGDKVGGKAAGIQVGDYALDPGPSIIIMPRIYDSVFKDAGRNMIDYLKFQRLDTVSRVFFGSDPAFDLPASEEDAIRLLNEIDPADAAALKCLLDKLSTVEPLLDSTIYHHAFTQKHQLLNLNLLKFAVSLGSHKTYKDQVDGMFRSPLLRAFFYGFPSYGGQTYAAKSPGALLIPYYMLRDGVFFPDGGVRAIPQAFERLARELGVEFRLNCRVNAMNGDDKWLHSISLSDGEQIPAHAFISNIDRFTIAALKGTPTTLSPSFSYFTAQWGIQAEFDQLEHHNLFIPTGFETGFRELYSRGEFPSRPIVYLNSTSRLDPSAAPKGKSNLFAVVTSPSKNEKIDWNRCQGEFVARIQSALENRGIVWNSDSVDFQRVQSPEYFEAQHGNYRGSLYGLDETNRQWGMFPQDNLDDKWANLTYAGGSVQPGAGLPMVTLSGRFAVDLIRPRP